MTLLSRSAIITLFLLLPMISAQSANLTVPTNSVQFECTPLRVFDLQVGRVQNCAAAIIALPQWAGPVAFHSLNPGDVGHLPVTKTHGDCTVTVDLIAISEFGSWTSVNLAASLLMTACTDISLNTPYTGGFVITGDRAGVKVTLGRHEPGVAAGNGSGLLTE